MESELFEEIVLGDFPDFAKAEGVKTGSPTLKAGKLLKATLPMDRKGVLKFRKQLFDMINAVTGASQGMPAAPGTETDPVLHPEKWYYKPVAPVSSGRTGIAEKLFWKLTECESSLLLGALLPFLSDEKNTGDAVYFGNLAIRKWSDYLHQLTPGEIKENQLRHLLCAMLCDLSERLHDECEGTADYFSYDLIQDFFPDDYDAAKVIYPTHEYTNVRLRRLIRESDEIWEQQLVEMLSEMGSLLKKNLYHPETVKNISKSILATERALFLTILKAPFMKDRPEKIAEPHFLKKWLTGFKKDLKSIKPKDFSQVLRAFERTESILQAIPAAKVVNEKMKGKSEIREMIRSVKLGNEYFTEERPLPVSSAVLRDKENNDKENTNHETDEWVEELANQFLTKDQVKRIFHIETNDVFVAFIERHNLTYHEASTHNHLYLRSEVMELLEKIRKRGGE